MTSASRNVRRLDPTARAEQILDEATRFLRGESQNVRRMYQKLMEEAAEKLEFERAATYRNRLWALAHVQADQAINPQEPVLAGAKPAKDKNESSKKRD